MTNKEKFEEVFKREARVEECPVYCMGEHDTKMCPYNQQGCLGSWWDKEYKGDDIK